MREKIAFSFLVLTLFGGGCLGRAERVIPPYMMGKTPTAEQLTVMTDEEKMKGIHAMMENISTDEMSKEGQAQEVQKSISYMKTGDTSRFGDFMGGLLHPASGSVRVVEDHEKSVLVFSEDFSVLLAPTTSVYLSSHTAPQKAEAVMNEGFEIAPLKTARGVQTYELPDNISIGTIHSVVIVSKSFQFILANASF